MTEVIQGEVRIQGYAHGALNTLVVNYDDRDEWEFRQFVSQEQLDKFAADNHYTVIYPPEKE